MPASTPAPRKARITQADIDAHAAALATATARIAELEGANESLREKLTVADREASHLLQELERLTEAAAIADLAKPPKPPRPPRVVPQDELDRIQKMAIAKAKAIAGGPDGPSVRA